MNNRRYLIIWDRIGDYHRARIKAFKELVGKEAVYTADLGSTDKLYRWKTSAEGKRHFVLSEKPVDCLDIRMRILALRNIIQEQGITDMAIAGYAHPEYALFLILGRLHGLRIVMFGESWYGHNRLKNRLKGFFLNKLVDCFFLSGKRAEEHFREHLGISGEMIVLKYSVVDNQHFSVAEETDRKPVLLCVARFSPEKNLTLLIEAFRKSRLAETHSLRLIGGGPEKEKLKGLVKDGDQVDLVDWVDYENLPFEYARARFFILPSLFEPWGLVVNEAMAAGLPVVVSQACGCAPDLVTRRNGLVFDEKNEEELIRVLDSLSLIGEEKWNSLSASSTDIIFGYDCLDWAEQLKRAFSRNENH